MIERKNLSPKLKLPVAIAKMIGDAFAGLYYAPQSVWITAMACVVFLCNVATCTYVGLRWMRQVQRSEQR